MAKIYMAKYLAGEYKTICESDDGREIIEFDDGTKGVAIFEEGDGIILSLVTDDGLITIFKPTPSPDLSDVRVIPFY